jgi:pimeloyl-ACP methyl ester carboxylesterase
MLVSIDRKERAVSTFALVHGSWGGSWVWDRVAETLRAEGHVVAAPTLTGLAERQESLAPTVNLSTHIGDVERALVTNDFTDVVLVGHSYGGMVTTGVAHRLPQRVSRLVYLDAFVPQPGQSCMDLQPAFEETFIALAHESGGLYMAPLDPSLLGVADPDLAASIGERSTPMPLATHVEKLPAPPSGGTPTWPPITYINCTTPGVFAATAASGREAGWEVIDLDADHFAQITAPDAVLDILRASVSTPISKGD